MTTRFKTLATSAVLLGSLGALGLAAVAPAQPAEGAAPARRAAPLGPGIAPLTPTPNAREVAARVTAPAPITRIQLLVDGRAVAASAVHYDAARQRVSYATELLAPGQHVARLTVWDRSGAYRWQEWSFAVAGSAALTKATATARQFLDAFRRDDKAGMLRLMSPRLLERNRDERVVQMLGAQNTPRRIEVVSARQVGTYGRVEVVAELRFVQGSVADRLDLIPTAGGYRVDAIAPLQQGTPSIQVAPASGPAGTTVTISGQGWPAGTRVVLSMGGAATGAGGSYGAAVADGRGQLTMRAHLAMLPNGAPLPAGQVTLLVHNADGSLKAATPFTVTR